MGLEIVDYNRVRRESLNPYQYTLSLLKEGLRTGLIDKQALYGIQEQIMMILKDLIMRYTKGESTSVKTETAEAILSSIYYAIDAYMCSLNDPEEGVMLLKSESIKEMHEKGMGMVKACVEETKMLYREMAKKKLKVHQEIYHSTIEALPGFFKNYGVVFNAHDTPVDIDYPLVFDDMNVQGVFYIRNYIINLNTENLFCRHFNQAEIVKLLADFGRISRLDYKEAPFNIFEVVINNSIFSVLLGNAADTLAISRFQYEILHGKLSGLSASGIKAVIDEAVERVISGLSIEQPKLIDYLQRYKIIFAQRLINAAENNSLHNIIITGGKANASDSNAILMEGNKLSDAHFRSVVRRISECESIEEKVSIIKSNIHSFADFIDVLNAGCLFGDEFAAVFAALSEMELTVLGRAVSEGAEIEAEWQEEYMKFMQGSKRK